MCSDTSQYIPSTATSSETPSSIEGSAAHTGIAVARSAPAAMRESQLIRPLR